MSSYIDVYKELKQGYGDPPEHSLVEYIDFIKKGKVLDLGCGYGRNSLFLAQKGYDVEGVDREDKTIEHYTKRAKELGINIKGTVSDIRDFKIKEEEYELIILSYILIFFSKKEVDEIIKKAKKGLKKNGVIYFAAFSIEDDYYIKNLDKACEEENSLCFNEENYRHYYVKDEVLKYFEDFKLISFKEGKFLDRDEEIGDHYHCAFEYLGYK